MKTRLKNFLIIFLIFIANHLSAQFTPKTTVWDVNYGEKKTEQSANKGIETSDSSYIFVGYQALKGDAETAIWKIDKSGTLINKVVLAEGVENKAKTIIALSNGGYVVVSALRQQTADEFYDILLIKIDDDLKIINKEKIGGAANDFPTSAAALDDGSFVVVGGTSSQGNGRTDMHLMKMNNNLTLDWEKNYGDKKDEGAKDVLVTEEGFLIVGYTESIGEGGKDFYIVKTDFKGNVLQEEAFGRPEDDVPNCVIKTADEGFLIGGYTVMGYVEGKGTMAKQLSFLKLDKDLNVQWGKRRLLGDIKDDEIRAIINTSDKGYTIAAYTSNPNKGYGNTDLWLLRFGEFGNQEWETIIGGKKDDIMRCMIASSDGKYILAGHTKSKGDSKNDLWICKFEDEIPLEEEQFLSYEQKLQHEIQQGIIGFSKKKFVSFNYKTAFINYYPQVEKEVNVLLAEMMKQGTYETKETYTQRIKLSNSIKKEEQITQDILKKYAEKQIRLDSRATIEGNYNPDNQTFKIKIPGTEDINVRVPISGDQAINFKENWSTARFAEVRYGLYNKKFVIANANIIVNGKMYPFVAKETTEYGKDMQLTINTYDEKQLRIATIYSEIIKAVKDSMEVWEKKDEFETQQQYATRTTIAARKLAEEDYTQKVLEKFAPQSIRLDGLVLGKYIAEQEKFPIEIKNSEPIYLHVEMVDSIDDKFIKAKQFKDYWNSYQFSNVKYGIYDYRYVVLSADISVSNEENDTMVVKYNAIADADYGKQIQKAIYLQEVDYGLLDQYTYLSLFPDGEQKVVPPKLLLTNINFSDFDGNKQIDANEDTKVSFTIINNGKGKAYRLNLKVFEMNGLKGLDFEKSITLGNLDPEQKLDTAFTISATRELEQGNANFKIRLTEANRNNPDDVELRLVTNKFIEPKIELEAYEFTNQTGGKTQFSSNVYLKLKVINKGKGTAKNVKVKIINPGDAILAPRKMFEIGSIRSGETKLITYDFIVSNAYSKKEIPFQLILSEEFEKYGEVKTVSMNIDSKLTPYTTYEIASDVDVEIPKTDSIYRNRFALIIGNEDYAKFQSSLNSESDVEFAAADAIVFQRYAKNVFGIPEENILFKVNAKSHEMNKMIDQLVELSKTSQGKAAEVIVFYAGHGFPDEVTKEPYIMPVDISGANVTNGIRLTSLYDKLTTAPHIARTTVFIDACFSGGGREQGLLAARAVKIKPKETELKEGQLVVFSASSGDQTALPYSEKNHGMFTYALLKKLKETEGDISYRFLSDFIVRFVENKSRRVNNKEQNPKTNCSAGAADNWQDWKVR